MAPKSWHLDRRSFLRGLGVTCSLPWLEAMERDVRARAAEAPRRAAFMYFPNGCSLPDESDTAYAHWRWFPHGLGRDFRFTRTLESLEPFRDDVAIYGGLSHPKSRELLGHLAGDTFLTAGDLRGGHYQNSISVDQVAARHLKQYTRYPCLVLSTDGGVGYKSRVATLSFDGSGRPIPAEHDQRRIFERYFAGASGETTEARRGSIERGLKIVDLVHDESKRLSSRLGQNDRRKLDEFLSSLNSVEEQVRRNESWLDTPMKPFDASNLDLDPNPEVDPTAYVRATYDLMVLGFQTDATRVMTYQVAREDGMGFGDRWPRLVIGVNKGHHTITHDTHEGHFDEWGALDRWFAEQFAYFVRRMKETTDEWGPLLDRTMLLYGSACSTTHNARNLPLALVGGRDLGLRLGHHTRFSRTAVLQAQNDPLSGALVEAPEKRMGEDDLPLSNLFLAMLHALGVEEESFADSTGTLDGFFA